jgi:mRNA interferase RelE/StbE
MRQVLISQMAKRQLEALPSKERRRMVKALLVLGEDPLRPRPGADIKKLEGTNPPKYRLRLGDWRAVYLVESGEVRIIEVFRRGRGYRVD